MSKTISHEDWLTELASAQGRNDAGLTTAEWASRMGVCSRTALDRIRKAVGLGWVKNGRRTIQTIDGRQSSVPVYTISKPKGAK